MLLIALGLAGLAGGEAHFERAASRDIASRLQGPARQVKVDIQPKLEWGSLEKASIQARDFSLEELPFYAEPQYGAGGKIDLLQLRLQNFRLRGLLVDELQADIPRARFDLTRAVRKGELRLNTTGIGLGSVKISEAALAEWINAKYAEIKSCTVKIDRDVVWVEGYGEFLIVKSNFAVIARIAPVDGVKLTLVEAKIYFDWQRASPLAAQSLLKVLNPVVDLAKDLGLSDAVSVDSIRLRDGYVLARGATKIPLRPAENSQ
jgi:hypothetical protein